MGSAFAASGGAAARLPGALTERCHSAQSTGKGIRLDFFFLQTGLLNDKKLSFYDQLVSVNPCLHQG